MRVVIYTTLERREEAEDIAFEKMHDFLDEGDILLYISTLRGFITHIGLDDNDIMIIDSVQGQELGEPLAADYAILDSDISLGSWFLSLIDSVENQEEFEIF